MSEVHNLQALKKAVSYSKDLESIVEMMSADINKYNKYIKYKPVKRLLDTLKEELSISKAHLEGCKKIINSKGQIK